MSYILAHHSLHLLESIALSFHTFSKFTQNKVLANSLYLILSRSALVHVCLSLSIHPTYIAYLILVLLHSLHRIGDTLRKTTTKLTHSEVVTGVSRRFDDANTTRKKSGDSPRLASPRKQRRVFRPSIHPHSKNNHDVFYIGRTTNTSNLLRKWHSKSPWDNTTET